MNREERNSARNGHLKTWSKEHGRNQQTNKKGKAWNNIFFLEASFPEKIEFEHVGAVPNAAVLDVFSNWIFPKTRFYTSKMYPAFFLIFFSPERIPSTMELVFSLSRACSTNFQWKTFVYVFPLFFFHLEPNFFRLQHLSRCTLSIFFPSVFSYSPDFHAHFLFHRYLCNWNQTIASTLVERRSRMDNRAIQNDELQFSYLAVIDMLKSLNIGDDLKNQSFHCNTTFS